MSYDAVIFDNDGVLVEPTDPELLREAAWDTFETLGAPDAAPDHVEAMTMGVSVDELHDVCETYGFDPETFWRQRDRDASRHQRDAMRAGEKPAYPDLQELAAFDVPIGVVSTNQQATIDFVCEHFGVNDHVETAYGREEGLVGLRRKKPDPHYLDRAMADVGVEAHADAVLYVGDSESDVRAAENAGVDSAFARRPHRESFDLTVSPTHEVRTLSDVRDIA